ncbi:MAG: thioredoxin family protein [Rhodospirillaceae bacterium]
MANRTLLKALTVIGPVVLGMSGAHADLSKPQLTSAALPSPLPFPYNEQADAKAEVAAAIARAKASGKYVLLDFGGNWCPDCRVLGGVLELNEVEGHVARTFEVAMIDVGRFNKNLDIAQTYGVKITAVPTVIILDPQGRFLNAGHPTALSNARAMKPQAIVDTIFGWLVAAN